MDILTIIISAAFNYTNIFFTFVIIAIFVAGIVCSRGNKHERMKNFLPSAAVSIGIFGTFWGIFIGLSTFDPHNISHSIPSLLDGMKTAFFTSLLGMFVSLLLKLTYAQYDDKYNKSSANPVKSLQNIELSSQEACSSIINLEKTISRCFRSEEEYSLVSQVKLIRQELIDSRRETKEAFTQFAEQFSKMASESLVKELQQVVDKFNVMLTDLVSQSFQDLKDSTERLNAWQAEHKESINQNQQQLSLLVQLLSSLKEAHEQTLEKTEKLAQHFSQIEQQLQSVTLSSSQLEEHTTSLAEQNQLLQSSIGEIQKAGELAAQVVPFLSERIENILTEVATLQHQTNTFVEETTAQLTAHTQQNSEVIKNIGIELQEHVKTTSEASRLHAENLQEQANVFVKTITTELKNNSDSLSAASAQQIKDIEEALQKELTEALSKFGGAIVSISNAFANDYLPLTNRLREVIQLAEKIKHV